MKDGIEIINPGSLGRPRGFSHGLLAPPGWQLLLVAGQTAADEQGAVAQQEFVAQFDVALFRVLEVVRSAGGHAAHVVRMTIYVTDLDAYRVGRRLLAEVWKRHMGSHYPAMALVEVSRLVDQAASVEIEATAMLPPPESRA